MTKALYSLLHFFLLIGFMSLSTFAQEGIAKVILLKGKVVEILDSDQSKITLKKGDWVQEGSIIESGKGSFAKLLFIDKSQMFISPKSSVRVKEFPKNEAGVIDLLQGRIRSKVSKNYMEIDKAKSKLFIKTKSAAMGVRGTDFQVVYNPKNEATSLVTFEGAVAMGHLKSGEAGSINRNSLEQRLNSSEAVIVKRGQYSGAIPGRNRVTIPVKISPAQLEVLRTHGEQVSSNSKDSSSSESSVRSIIPPGMNAKSATTDQSEVVESIATKVTGVDKSKLDQEKVDNGSGYFDQVKSDVPAEGLVDATTGAYAPPAGGYVDNETGLYVAPKKGAAYDSNADVYVPGPELGSIDPATGDYVPPKGYSLAENGVLTESTGRGPASESGSSIGVNILTNDFVSGADSSAEIEAETGVTIEAKEVVDVINRENTIKQNIINTTQKSVDRKKVEFKISR